MNLGFIIFLFSLFAVDDASGHYTTGLFYGNNYWIGSLSLCKAIYKDTISDVPTRGKYRSQSMSNVRQRFSQKLNLPNDTSTKANFLFLTCFQNFPAQNLQDQTAISFNDAYSTEILNHDNPPFIPGFYVLKVRINETEIAKYPRTIRLGMCLPNACSYGDIERMALLADENSKVQHQLDVIMVRSPTENVYEYWNDRTFVILM